MENRNRTVLVVLIAIVIAVAVFSSFGLEFYASSMPEITLPTVPLTQEPAPSAGSGAGSGEAVRVDVTPQTVQNVIRTLERPASYYREITVSYTASGGTVRSSQWVDGGWSRSETQLPSGQVRCTLIGDGTLYYWYQGSRNWYTAGADERSADADAVHIPTYEDVLEVPVQDITQAGYVELDGEMCIYVAVGTAEEETHYWVSVDSGLLVAAQRTAGETVVLSMTSTPVERPAPPGTQFALPDGSVLHTVQAGSTVSPAPAPEAAQG